MDWCTIESDPGVFTELIDQIGVKDVQVMELYSLDEESMSKLKPVYGLIFLFKWTGEKDEREIDQHPPADLFFARQVITNACATQAILSVILNCDDIEIGQDLQSFKEFASAFDPEMRGDSIGNMENVRIAHNSFNRPDTFGFSEDTKSSGKSDAFHFIAYVPFRGKVYELDGLKQGPIWLGDIGSKDWLNVVRPHISARIENYGGEIRFNLMAITQNLSSVNKQLAKKCGDRIDALEGARGGSATTLGFDAPIYSDEDFEMLLGSHHQVAISTQLDFEKRQRDKAQEEVMINDQLLASWKQENVRRRTNYIPLAIAILKTLAEQKKLSPAVVAAKAKRQNTSQ